MVRQSLLDPPEFDRLRAAVVWIPMLDADELPAAQTQSAEFRGAGVPQFWDGEQRLGLEVARTLGEPDQAAWDIYLYYAPEDAWTAAGLPAARALLAQAGMTDHRTAVIAPRGLLPPSGDQSRLPPYLARHVEIVGEPESLGPLLQQLARRQLADGR